MIGFQTGPNDLDSISDKNLLKFADHYFEYDSDRRVALEIAAVCASCPGGGTSSDTFVYTQRSGSYTNGPNSWDSNCEQTLPDGAKVTLYSNEIGMPIFAKYVKGSDAWYRAWKYDTNNSVVAVAESSAIDASKLNYGLDDIVNWGGGSASSIWASIGLVRTIDYYTSTSGSGVLGYIQKEYVQPGQASSSQALLRQYFYTSHTTGSDTVYLPDTLKVYPDAANTSTVIETSWAYTFNSSSNFLASRTTTLPAVLTTQNGSGTTSTVVETFDAYGNTTQRTDELGTVNTYQFDVVLRRMTQSKLNYQSGGSTSPGVNVATDMTYDSMGSLTRSIGPSHTIDLSGMATAVSTVTWNVDVKSVMPSSGTWAIDQRRTGRGYATGSSTYSYTLINPVTLMNVDKDGRTIDAISAARSSTSGPLSASDTFSQSSWQSWTHNTYADTGQLTSTRVYHNIPSSGTGSSPTNYGQTSFEYDDLQRVIKRTAPGGTITYTVWSAPQRVKEVWVGTNATGATQGNPGNSGGSGNNLKIVTANVYDGGNPGGDGTLTQVTQYAAASDTRVTTFGYDFRNRRVSMDGEVDVYAAYTYDNLNRLIQTDRKDTSSSGSLIGRSQTLYDDGGRVYRQNTYAVASGSAGNYLSDNTWYDAAGRPFKRIAAGAGEVFDWTEYNQVGWVTSTYRGVGTSSTLSSNTIVTQTENTYDQAGNVIRSLSYDRWNDASGTGLLTTSNARVSYTDMYPDALGRSAATVQYGVAGSFTRSTTIPTRSNDRLVTANYYDDAGRLYTVIDPMDVRAVYNYDDAGRRVSVINDATDLALEVDYTYTLDNQIATQVALNQNTGNQTTTYTYGSTLSTSDIARNDLLVNTAYPDSTSSSDTVTTTYNRLGQKKTMTEQRGVVHEYAYDKLGRQADDKVTSLGSSGIVDSSVLRIAQEYEVRGMVKKVTSYDAASSGSVVNQCQMEFNGFGQLTKEYQEHSGSVNTSTTPSVQYAYEPGNVSTTQTNQVRATTMTYPAGRVIENGYGTSGGLNDKLNRVASIEDNTNSVTLAQYTYLGSGLAVRVKYPEPKVLLDLWGGSSGTFNGLDRFNRVIDQRWQNNVDTSPADIDRYKYGYDRNSNRVWKENVKATADGKAFDEVYAYDNVNRLVNMERGTLNSGHTGITGTPEMAHVWTLDETGNWSGFDTYANGTQDLAQSRSNNAVNEITGIGGTPNWADPSYDAAGNMTAFVKPGALSSNLTGKYDAWNKLTEMKDGLSTLSKNRHDGKRRTVISEIYTGGTLSGVRHFFYNFKWQNVEERLGGASSWNMQYVWGYRYLDEVLLRYDAVNQLFVLQDVAFNVTALISDSGALQERYVATPYGKRSIFDSTWTARSVSIFDWELGLHGLMLDAVTDLFTIRNRVYSLLIGTWSSRDRLGYQDAQNMYIFLRSNPINRMDPLGLMSLPCDTDVNNSDCQALCGQPPGPRGVGDNYFHCCICTANIKEMMWRLWGLCSSDPTYDYIYVAIYSCAEVHERFHRDHFDPGSRDCAECDAYRAEAACLLSITDGCVLAPDPQLCRITLINWRQNQVDVSGDEYCDECEKYTPGQCPILIPGR